jgi:hypothetical protein
MNGFHESTTLPLIGISWWPTLVKHRVDSMYLGSIDRVLEPMKHEGWTRGWKMEAHLMRGRRRMQTSRQ